MSRLNVAGLLFLLCSFSMARSLMKKGAAPVGAGGRGDIGRRWASRLYQETGDFVCGQGVLTKQQWPRCALRSASAQTLADTLSAWQAPLSVSQHPTSYHSRPPPLPPRSHLEVLRGTFAIRCRCSQCPSCRQRAARHPVSRQCQPAAACRCACTPHPGLQGFGGCLCWTHPACTQHTAHSTQGLGWQHTGRMHMYIRSA